MGPKIQWEKLISDPLQMDTRRASDASAECSSDDDDVDKDNG